jgi:hypothetical protein
LPTLLYAARFVFCFAIWKGGFGTMMALDVLYIILLAFVAGRISCVIVPVKLDAVIHWFTDVEEEDEDDDDV